jgi:Flp pilus assembly pilin Flp
VGRSAGQEWAGALVFRHAATAAGEGDSVASDDGTGRDREITKIAMCDRAITLVEGFIIGANNMTFLRSFWREEQGQDLIEYTLLMAFVALASAALFLGAGTSIKGIWTNTAAQLNAANTNLSGGS